MTVVVCPGTFDPVTHGHLDVIARASRLFDQVVVAVLTNPGKRPVFSSPERLAMLQESLDELDLAGPVRAEAVPDGLLTDFCAGAGAVAIVKGVRGGPDYAYELPMARMNRHLSGIETVFLPGDPGLEHVSSSLVKEVASYGGDVSGLIPESVLARLLERVGPVGQTDNHLDE